jgi:hypothetical protein
VIPCIRSIRGEAGLPALAQTQRPRNGRSARFDRNLHVLGRRSKKELVEIAYRAFMGSAGARRWVNDPERLRGFLWEVGRHYRNNPYHNFPHAVDTTNVMAWLLSLPRIRAFLPDLYVFVLLIAAIVHDLDHPGTDNNWEIKTHSERARRYHNVAVLEHHSLDLALRILSLPEYDLFADHPPRVRKEALHLLALTVLATDFSMHRAFLQELESYLDRHPHANPTSSESLSLLARTLIKAADISNTSKDFPQARLWGKRIMREYWAQGEKEKRSNLPLGPLNDRNKVEFHAAQGWFIENQVTPLFLLLAQFDEEVQDAVDSLAVNGGLYRRLAQKKPG